jgi:DNA-binding winged helix-turn-helix (wHTH) protein/tetratricopeptide (TPR) repeat protein
MAADRQFNFGPFRFDARTGELWRDGREARLTPRATAVLTMLAARAGQLVTKQELFDQVWGGMAVTDDALTSCIQELRGVLGDDARRPRYIETRHRRGYRLMMPMAEEAGRAAIPMAAVAVPEPARLVGRDAEMQELSRGFSQALSGRRQITFVTGEPGIGKSALTELFQEQLRADHQVRTAHGQCLDHHGVGEPYLPLIEALMRLAGGFDGDDVKEILATHAPSWLAQMPSLWSRSDRGALEARGRATRDRMMRELTEAVEAIATKRPLLLKLEDIHWSDASTLDWLAHVARRPEPARLMLLATFRPADAAAIKAGLGGVVAELALHGRCREISLRPLNLEAIETYLTARLGGADLGGADGESRLQEIAPLLLERTGGNPLFMTSIVNQLAQQKTLAHTPSALVSIPHDVRRFIERQIDDLDEGDRALLTAASVIRREFASTAVAAALETDTERVEADCTRLARQGVFIVKSGSTIWPDGTPAELYSFRHDLYRELLYDRLPATRRALSHARVGRRLEAAWAGRLDAIASELAEHFERGNEVVRAIPHHQRAAAKALRRSANDEAIGHLRRALEAIGHIADADERARVEVNLQVAIGAVHIGSRGFGVPEVLEAYTRAEMLCEQLGERADLFPALWGQWMFRLGRSELAASRDLCDRLLALAEKSGSLDLKLQAHHAMWATAFANGALAEALQHADAGIALYDAKLHQAMASSYGNHDTGCCARNFSALSLALMGERDRARTTIDRSVAEARALGDPFSLALTLYFTAIAAQLIGNVALATENSQASMQVATEHALEMPKLWSTCVAGWCTVENGEHDRGLAMLEKSFATMHATQSMHFFSYHVGLLADARMKAGRHSDALRAVEEGIAFAERDGDRFYCAELYRMRGVLEAGSPGHLAQAEASFHKAIEIARKQGAAILEHKAKASLDRWNAKPD